MTPQTANRFVDALIQGTAVPGCPEIYQMIMGLALGIFLIDQRLERPPDQFVDYLIAYAENQKSEAQRKGMSGGIAGDAGATEKCR